MKAMHKSETRAMQGLLGIPSFVADVEALGRARLRRMHWSDLARTLLPMRLQADERSIHRPAFYKHIGRVTGYSPPTVRMTIGTYSRMVSLFDEAGERTLALSARDILVAAAICTVKEVLPDRLGRVLEMVRGNETFTAAFIAEIQHAAAASGRKRSKRVKPRPADPMKAGRRRGTGRAAAASFRLVSPEFAHLSPAGAVSDSSSADTPGVAGDPAEAALEALKGARAKRVPWHVVAESAILLRESGDSRKKKIEHSIARIAKTTGYAPKTIILFILNYQRVGRLFAGEPDIGRILLFRDTNVASMACSAREHVPEKFDEILGFLRRGDVIPMKMVREITRISASRISVAERLVTGREMHRLDQPRKVQPSIDPARKKEIRQLLGMHFDASRGMYAAGWSDAKIAEAVDVPRASVSQMRDVSYGPVIATPEMLALIDRHDGIEDEIDQAQADIREAEVGLAARRDRLRELGAQMREVKGQLRRMGISK